MKKKQYYIIGVLIFALFLLAIPKGINAFAATPNDQDFADQTSLTYINAQLAWDITTGSHDVHVGVMDSGIANHEDFGDNLLTGYDFFNNTPNTDDIADFPVHYHGTGVAGIIGAKGNNSKGISGICWDVSLIPLKIAGNASSNYLEDVVAATKAINYAKTNGIPIVNFSGGFTDVGAEKREGTGWIEYQTQKDNLKKAIKEYPGLIICAAGNHSIDFNGANSDKNKRIYPGQFKNEDSSIQNIIVVGASNANGNRYLDGEYSSNYGDLVDIYAPGTGIRTTNGTSYGSFSHTSGAAPHVTGVAALIKSAKPDATTAEIKAAILNNYSYGKNNDGTYNNGSEKILDAFKAVSSAAFSTSLSGSGIEINGFVGGYSMPQNTHLIIPDRFARFGETVQRDVVAIGGFGNNTSVRNNMINITIPDTVTTISASTFANCTNFGSDGYAIYLPSSVINIGNSAFFGCSNLESINIPSGVTDIDNYTFSGCSSLASIIIPTNITSVGADAFTGCTNLSISWEYNYSQNNGLTAVNFKDYLKNVNIIGETIAANAFENCTQLSQITIPSSVTIVRPNAFAGCTNLSITWDYDYSRNNGLIAANFTNYLKNVNIIGTIYGTTIGAYAFANCSKISLITIPSSIKSVDVNAFYGCTNLSITWDYDYSQNKGLTAINFRGYLKNVNITGTTIGASAFANCTKISQIKIPSSVTSVATDAFVGCTNLSITWDYDYSKNNGLTATYFRDYLKNVNIIGRTIGADAFASCTKISQITIPENVTSVDAKAFVGCTNLSITWNYDYSQNNGLKAENFRDYLKNVNITGRTIGADAFANCTKISQITIPENVTSVDAKAFVGCTNLSITWNYDYSQNNGLKAENFRDYLKNVNITGRTIVSFAFAYCTKISQITISNTLTNIEYYAFYGCTNLREVIFESGSQLQAIGANAFENCTGLSQITISNTVTNIEYYAFYGCTNLREVIFESGSQLQAIGAYAFANCSLSYITIPSSVEYIDFGAFSFNTSGVWLENFEFRSGSVLTKFIGNQTIYEIPEFITEVAGKAFADATGLSQITLPYSLEYINLGAFNNIANLEVETKADPACVRVEIPFGERQACIDAGWGDFNLVVAGWNIQNNTIIKYVVPREFDGLEIPDGVTAIAAYAFANVWLSYITIPESVEYIGTGAFHFNTSGAWLENFEFRDGSILTNFIGSQTSYIIPDFITEIVGYAFIDAVGLSQITLPYSLEYINLGAFDNTWSLQVITPIGVNRADITVEILFGERQAYIDEGWGDYNLVEVGFNIQNDTVMQFVASREFDGYLEIPDGVTAIAAYAFYDCWMLYEINIPESVTSIGDYAFYGCSTLYEINIPASVTHIGDNAFAYCAGLNNINVDVDNEYYSSLDSVLFNKDQTLLIYYPVGRDGDYTISNSITEIGAFAFAYCWNLTAITFEAGSVLTNIGDFAFYNCWWLYEINIPESVTSIGDYAFYGCWTLYEIYIPESVTSIGDSAFSFCSNLRTVNFSSESILTSIGDYAFYGCWWLYEINIPASVTYIGDNAFAYCDSLTNINVDADNEYYSSVDGVLFNKDKTLLIYCPKGRSGEYMIPNSVTEIGAFAFAYSNLAAINFGTGSVLEIIGEGAFAYCESLIEIIIPASVIEIGSSAFEGCYNLTIVTFETGSELTTIGGWAFYGCESLIEIIIPASVIEIGDSAFDGCYNLTTVNFGTGSGLTTIGGYAFYGCDILIELIIPASIREIGAFAFAHCTNLISVTFETGSELTTIGGWAFYGCESLEEIIIPASVVEINAFAFSNCIGLAALSFEANSQLEVIGMFAFSDCVSLSEVTFPESLQIIYGYAFDGCTGLIKVTIYAGVYIGEFAFGDLTEVIIVEP